MIEIEPTIDNVREGDTVTIERGTPGEPGHETLAVRATEGAESVAYTRSLGWLRACAMREVWKITRITRPAPPIPTEPGERFWARYEGTAYAEEFVVTSRYGETMFASLHDGLTWTPEEHSECFTVVPAPEPETVPETVPVPAPESETLETVPADLIRDPEELARFVIEEEWALDSETDPDVRADWYETLCRVYDNWDMDTPDDIVSTIAAAVRLDRCRRERNDGDGETHEPRP